MFGKHTCLWIPFQLLRARLWEHEFLSVRWIAFISTVDSVVKSPDESCSKYKAFYTWYSRECHICALGPFWGSDTETDFPRPVRSTTRSRFAATVFVRSKSVNWVRILPRMFMFLTDTSKTDVLHILVRTPLLVFTCQHSCTLTGGKVAKLNEFSSAYQSTSIQIFCTV